jgi:SAM-dependent methyltransferase
VPDVRDVWRSRWFDRFGAGVYDFVVERERLARPLGRLVWGTDARMLYDAMGVIGEMPDGSAILDLPCGGGVAFRALRPDQKVRYVAADLSAGMLRRARREAERRGLRQIEFLEADVESLPFDDGSFDLCVCFNSLHCFPNPQAAIAELARCLRRDGRFVGDAAVRGAGRRYDRLYELYRRRGVFGPGGTVDDLGRWFDAAGLREVSIERSGAVAHVRARR